MASDYKIYILGCRGTFPVFGDRYKEFGGSTTCFVITNKKHAIVLDCGSGLINAKELLKDCDTVDILISHVHYDHTIGLLYAGAFPENAKITFYGNFNKWFGTNTLKNSFLVEPYWPVDINYGDFVQLNCDNSHIKLSNGADICCIKTNHPNDCSSFKVTIDGKTISFLCDCEDYNDEIVEFVKNSDLLFYDSMFDVDDYDSHKGWGHSTWKIGCDLAQKANVNHLYPTHHNYEYDDEKLFDMEKRSKLVFNNTVFLREGMIIDLNK